jgi:hypothetical protein
MCKVSKFCEFFAIYATFWKEPLEYQGIDGRIILEKIFGLKFMRMDTGWSKLRIGFSGGLLW